MSTTHSHADLIERRGELLVELFLEESAPAYFVKTTAEIPYDYLVGFENPGGGINTCGIEVKSTEEAVPTQYQIPKDWYQRLTQSNLPVILFVANVKKNLLYYTWLEPDFNRIETGDNCVVIQLTEVDEQVKSALRQQFTA